MTMSKIHIFKGAQLIKRSSIIVQLAKCVRESREQIRCSLLCNNKLEENGIQCRLHSGIIRLAVHGAFIYRSNMVYHCTCVLTQCCCQCGWRYLHPCAWLDCGHGHLQSPFRAPFRGISCACSIVLPHIMHDDSIMIIHLVGSIYARDKSVINC